MFGKFLRTLAERLAQPFVELGVRLGRTQAAIGRALTRSGINVEAAALRRQVTRTREIHTEIQSVLGLPENQVLDPRIIPEAITKLRHQFAWTVKFASIDPLTGLLRDRFITVSTDRMLSAREAREIAEQERLEGTNPERGGLVSVEVTRVVKAGALGTL